MSQLTSHRAQTSPIGEKIGVYLAVLASLVWLLQAAVIAWVLGELLVDPSNVPALLVAAIFTGLAVVRSIIDASSQRQLSIAAEEQIAQLRDDIVAHETAAATPSDFGGAGAIAALAGEKLELLRPFLLRYKPARVRSMVLPITILIIAMWHSWAVALVLLLAGPLIPVFMALVGWAAKTASERQMVEIGQLSDVLVDRLAALSDLRLIGAGGSLVDGFAEASEGLRHRTMAVLRIAFLSSTVLELFSALGVAMVAIWVGFSLLGELGWGSWGQELSPAVGIYLLLLAPEFFQPLRDLAAAWHDRAAAEAVLDDFAKWQKEERPERLGPVRAVTDGDVPLGIRLENVSFRTIRYPDLHIGPGDTVAITGPSGSGKTTLLRLIAGLDEPEHGVIRSSDPSLTGDSADAWRAQIGWMPQAPHFLNRSLRYNIGFGSEVDASVINSAQLNDVIAHLPKGDLTQLGERGAGLSGGESRRVTLARAMNGKPQLILADEPTADLDMATAAAITDGLIAFAKSGGALVIATHDPNLIAQMDREIQLPPNNGGTA